MLEKFDTRFIVSRSCGYIKNRKSVGSHDFFLIYINKWFIVYILMEIVKSLVVIFYVLFGSELFFDEDN